MDKEGIIKFKIIFKKENSVLQEDISAINEWRNILFDKKLIGCANGIGYGNVSVLADRFYDDKKAFIITGSQTGNVSELTNKDYCAVIEYDFEKNLIVAKGLVKPSSESLSHAAFYDMDDEMKSVIHVHSAKLWEEADKLNISMIDKNAEYGSKEMPAEIIKTYKRYKKKKINLFCMAGHKHGLISFGKDPDQAGYAILEALKRLEK
ncbi:MAG: class II aldolase/adducin family protein [Deltaproteobacteria bacterium]|nr:class II aldolase/adducin family protein [Deltaproteobacteria bacterium]